MLFVPAAFNGHPTEALLDSAAESSFISPAFARAIGLDGGTSVTVRGSGAAPVVATLVDGVMLAVAGRRLQGVTVAVVDLSDIGRRLIGRPIDAIVGREIFDVVRLFIDIGAARFHPVDAAPRGVALPLTSADGTERLAISIEGRPAAAEFDLGNGSGVLVGGAWAAANGLFDGRPVGVATGGGIGGARQRRTIMLRELAVGGRQFRDVPASVDDSRNAAEANIGIAILRQFRITTDFAGHRLWLDPIAGAAGA